MIVSGGINDVIAIQQGQQQIVRVLAGTQELWPGGPVNSQGFLKYDLYNIKREFVGLELDPNATWDQTLNYHTNFNTEFLGPDTGSNPWLKDYDEFQKYDSGNIATEFHAFPPTGEYDQDVLYDYSNIITEFLGSGDVVDENAPLDQQLIYKDADFGTQFLGPDTGSNPWLKDYDEFQKYDSGNIAQKFNATIALGEYDQDVLYDYSNIITEFLGSGDVVDENAPLDQQLIYKDADFKTEFLGPDTGINLWVPVYNEFQKYDSGNIAQKFNAYVDTGAYDQDVLYDYTNIQTEFLGTVVPPVDENAPLDQQLTYKDADFGTQFLGPDTGSNPFVIDYFEFQKYSSGNIAQEFTNPQGNGYYDQNLVYSFSNITTYFLP